LISEKQKFNDIPDDYILGKVISNFPHYRNAIIDLYYESSNFLEVCEDYVLCVESIKKLESMDKLKNGKDINGLKFTMAELKDECLSRI